MCLESGPKWICEQRSRPALDSPAASVDLFVIPAQWLAVAEPIMSAFVKKFHKSMSASASGCTAITSRLPPRDRLGRRRQRGWSSAAGLQTQEIFPGSQDGDGTLGP
jgi:hypothetical protein